MKENKNREENKRNRDANPDPITGAPGSHPVGTGLGAAAGAAAGTGAAAAIGAGIGTAAGPIGTIAGGAVGAVVGGLAGKGVAEKVNPTEEDAYWREHYKNEAYYDPSYTYDDYQAGYRTGYEGYGKYGSSGRSWSELEPEFRSEYEKNRGESRLSWDQAQPAARAAFNRFENRRLERYVGYDVVDRNGSKIGTLDCLWSDPSGEPAYVGVKTGWFMGKTHVVPAEAVQVSENSSRVRLPYEEQRVKDAPTLDADSEVTFDKEQEIRNFYGLGAATHHVTGETNPPATGLHTQETGTRSQEAERAGQATPEQATIQLSEEQLKVRKRQVEVGGVRLRKIIRTEVVNQPVELQREEIVIERVPASEAHTGRQQAFNEQEVYIPLRREEATVEKETRLREEVRARKAEVSDQQQVSGEVRREDVEIEETGDARRRDPRGEGGRGTAEDIRKREEQPRSMRRHT